MNNYDPSLNGNRASNLIVSSNGVGLSSVSSTTQPVLLAALKRHMHAALILERARQDAFGETAAGWWKWEFVQGGNWLPCSKSGPDFTSGAYLYSRTDKHPEYVPPKPKLKLIDMLALPKGSMVHTSGETDVLREVLGLSPASKALRLLHPMLTSLNFDTHYLRIAEQKNFTYWGGGDKCPAPEGVTGEIVQRNGCSRKTSALNAWDWRHYDTYDTKGAFDIIGYRIMGVVAGWTDNPELAK